MQKEDLEVFKPLVLEDAAKRRDARSFSIRTTSGTTGTPLITVTKFSVADVYRFDGIGRGIAFFGSMNARLANALFFFTKPSTGESLLSIDGSDLADDTKPLLSQFHPDGLVGFPSFIARALEHAGPLHSVSRVVLTGEHLSPTIEAFLRKGLPNAQILMEYSCAEIGVVSEPGCGFLPPNQYHPRTGVSVEIEDVDAEGVGDILVSKKMNELVTVLKYRIGDVGTFVHDACRCGNPTTFAVLGRRNLDYIKLAGALLRQEEFDRAYAALGSYVADYRVTAEETLKNGNVIGTLHLYINPRKRLREMKDGQAFIAGRFADEIFVTPSQTLADLIDQRIFSSIDVIFSDAFPPILKNVKLKKI